MTVDARIARAADAVRHVREVVADEDERSAGRECGGGLREHGPALVRRDVEVEDENEVEGAGLGLVLDEVGAHEVDRDAVTLRPRPRLCDRDLRVVDAGDVPAERREPDRVLPLAAGEVERSPRLEVARPPRRGSDSA